MNKSNNGASNSGMAATDGCAATSISSASTSTSSTTAHSGGNTDGGISISDQQTQSQTAGSGSYCASSAPSAASSTTNGASSQLPYPRSPPKAEVDESPLQKSMDRNKQSLKVKLMLRRPITQLVAQGIMPQLKISPTIHEQRQKLERAKMGDLLKAKIQQRPDRQELVRQHILEADVGHVDPSLAERHRMLKKCRLVDSLNDQLSHRPGPLELIKKNILHTEEPIERAVKEGHIEFRATCEGQKVKLEPPDHYMTVDDDSQSSDAQSPRDSGSFISGADLSPPSSNGCAVSQSSASTANNSVAGAVSSDHNVYSELFSQTACDVLETAAKQAGIVTVVVPSANLVSSTAPSPISIGSSTSSLSPLSSVASPSSSINPNNTNNSNSASSNSSAFSCSSPALSASRTNSFSSHQSSSARDKNRKKSKSKSQQQKTRTIKFHEYKGPPSAHKNNNASLNSANSETSYDLLLKQQQLFLQWQLEWQQKYPQLKMPVSAKNMDHPMSPASPQIVGVPSPSPVGGTQQQIKQEQQSSTVPTMSSTPTPPPLPPPPPPPLPSNVGIKLLRNLEEMKVSDLKAELKKRNLPMSGPKPSLILRLKSFTENNRVNGMNSNTSNNISNNGKTILSDFNGNIVTVNKNNHSNSTNENSNVQSNLTIPYTEDSLPDSSVPSPMQHVSLGSVEHMDITRNSPQPPDTSVNKVTSSVESSSMKEITDEEIIKEQQKKIEELQRQLLNSQLLLQQQQRQQQHARSTKTFQPQQAISAKANLAAFLQQQQLNNLLIQQQKLQQQKQSFNQQANASNNVTSNSNTTTATSSNNNSNSNNNNNNNSNSNNSNSNNNNNNNNHNSNINGYSKQKISTANVQNKNEISTVKSNAQRQRSNTVILGQHPVTLMLNQVNLKSHNNQQRTNSLPNFVGTFVQPHLLLTDGSNIQQLVIDNDAIILPEQTKLDNFVNITSASSAPNNTNCNSNGTNSSGNNVPTISTLNSAAGGLNPVSDSRKIDQHLLLGSTVNGVQNGQQIVLENGEGGRIILENGTNRIILKDGSQFVFTNSGSNENPIGKLAVSANQRNNNFVTVGPFENNNSIVGSIEKTEPKTEPEYMASDDNNDISDLFKHDGERSIADVDDVLEMLMGSEEFLSMGTTTSNSEQPTMPDFVVSSAELSNGSSGISLTHSLASSSPVISSVVSSSSSSPLLSASPNNSSSSSSAGAVTTSSNNNSANVLNNGNNSGNNITTSLCNSIYGFRTGRSSDPTMDQNLPSQHVSLEALGLDVETFPPMDLVEEPTLTSATTGGLSSSSSSSLSSFMNNSESSNNRTEMMDVDTDWLDRLISSELDHSNLVANISSSSSSNYEPMMSGDTDPLDFFSIDDNDYKMAAEFCWDRVDFAT